MPSTTSFTAPVPAIGATDTPLWTSPVSFLRHKAIAACNIVLEISPSLLAYFSTIPSVLKLPDLILWTLFAATLVPALIIACSPEKYESPKLRAVVASCLGLSIFSLRVIVTNFIAPKPSHQSEAISKLVAALAGCAVSAVFAIIRGRQRSGWKVYLGNIFVAFIEVVVTTFFDASTAMALTSVALKPFFAYPWHIGIACAYLIATFGTNLPIVDQPPNNSDCRKIILSVTLSLPTSLLRICTENYSEDNQDFELANANLRLVLSLLGRAYDKIVRPLAVELERAGMRRNQDMEMV